MENGGPRRCTTSFVRINSEGRLVTVNEEGAEYFAASRNEGKSGCRGRGKEAKGILDLTLYQGSSITA